LDYNKYFMVKFLNEDTLMKMAQVWSCQLNG